MKQWIAHANLRQINQSVSEWVREQHGDTERKTKTLLYYNSFACLLTLSLEFYYLFPLFRLFTRAANVTYVNWLRYKMNLNDIYGLNMKTGNIMLSVLADSRTIHARLSTQNWFFILKRKKKSTHIFQKTISNQPIFSFYFALNSLLLTPL